MDGNKQTKLQSMESQRGEVGGGRGAGVCSYCSLIVLHGSTKEPQPEETKWDCGRGEETQSDTENRWQCKGWTANLWVVYCGASCCVCLSVFVYRCSNKCFSLYRRTETYLWVCLYRVCVQVFITSWRSKDTLKGMRREFKTQHCFLNMFNSTSYASPHGTNR